VEHTTGLSTFRATRPAGATVTPGGAMTAPMPGPRPHPTSWSPRSSAQPSPCGFSTVYREEYPGLVRLAYLILGSREQAEEVVQDAFVRLHDRWQRIDNPAAYLRTSVVNGCRDVRRRLVRYRAREPRLAVKPETWDTPDELADVLATLPVRQRSALVLRYYAGLSEAEIALALGVRPGTVKSSIHRGLARLRQELT
jgi:RNA polymerase sigma-70 factor (sigma-E family)